MAIMTYGKAFGFLDRGEDVNSMIRRLDARLDIISPVCHRPVPILLVHYSNLHARNPRCRG